MGKRRHDGGLSPLASQTPLHPFPLLPQVSLVSLADELQHLVSTSAKQYHHVTLAVAEGASAKDANALPGRVASGEAKRVELPEPLVLSGQILGVARQGVL